MFRKSASIALAVVLASALLAGCQNDGEDQRMIVSVVSINAGAPLAADIYHYGEDKVPSLDDFIPEDWVSVFFLSEGYNSIVKPGNFLVTGYAVTWTRMDGGPALPAAMDVIGATSVLLMPGDINAATILLVPFVNKTLPEITVLLGGGEIRAVATIDFWGHEVGSGSESTFTAYLTVNFGDFADVD